MRCLGMVQVLGTTYRVQQASSGSYEVVRISDDTVAGSFSCGQTVKLAAKGVDLSLMRQLARAAVQGGKTRWMGRVNASTGRLADAAGIASRGSRIVIVPVAATAVAS
jgi:hypothetical protein